MQIIKYGKRIISNRLYYNTSYPFKKNYFDFFDCFSLGFILHIVKFLSIELVHYNYHTKAWITIIQNFGDSDNTAPK